MSEIAPALPPKVGRPRTVVALVLIPVFDVLLLTGGAVAVFTLLWQLAIRLPWALLTRRSPEWRSFRLQRAALYIAVAIATFGITRLDDAIAERRAGQVVTAIKAYLDEQGRYPKTLDELTPRHMGAVPDAHPLALWQGRFHYRSFEGGTEGKRRHPTLIYILVAPMGWMAYDFDANEWRYRD